MNKPNPIIQIFYLLIAGGGFIIYVKRGMMVYVPGPLIPMWHCVTGSILMFICYYSFYRACTDDPGIIKTPEDSLEVRKRYEFDEVMFCKD